MTMKKHVFPKLLSLAILSTLFVFLAAKKADVPAAKTFKSQVSSQTVKTVSYRVVDGRKFESGFVGWSIYRIVRPSSGANGEGC